MDDVDTIDGLVNLARAPHLGDEILSKVGDFTPIEETQVGSELVRIRKIEDVLQGDMARIATAHGTGLEIAQKHYYRKP